MPDFRETTLEEEHLKIGEFYFRAYTVREAHSKLKELGIDAKEAVVCKTFCPRGGEYEAFSYDFIHNGRNVATYYVHLWTLIAQPGIDGFGREYSLAVPYISADRRLITYLVGFVDGVYR